MLHISIASSVITMFIWLASFACEPFCIWAVIVLLEIE